MIMEVATLLVGLACLTGDKLASPFIIYHLSEMLEC